MSTKLHVTHLSPATTESDVERLFSTHGRVLAARVSTHPDAGPPAESAIVEMESESAAAAAIRALDGSDLAGRALTVAPATRRNETDAAGTSQFGPMNMTADDDEQAAPRGPAAAGPAEDDPGVIQAPPTFSRAGPAGEMRSLAFQRVPTRAEAGPAAAPGLRAIFASATRSTLAGFGVKLR
jgi:RNA recognition motif-containing protein